MALVRQRIPAGMAEPVRMDLARIGALALHLIQNCMVYIHTLMIQKVLAHSAVPAHSATRLLRRLFARALPEWVP